MFTLNINLASKDKILTEELKLFFKGLLV